MFEVINGRYVFSYGKDNSEKAEETAGNCPLFRIDCEDELVEDEDVRTCYNCIYRRWTADSFECVRKGGKA